MFLALRSTRTGRIPRTFKFALRPKSTTMESYSQAVFQSYSMSPLHVTSPTSSAQAAAIEPIEQEIQGVAQSIQTVRIVSNGSAAPLPIRQVPSRGGPAPRPKGWIGGSVRGDKVQPSPASGGIPDPTSKYLALASGPARPLPIPQHLLVVIDLNGTLLFRPNRKSPTKFTARPHTQRFLKYCIDTFTVVIWSSARPDNVRNMCDAILSPDMRKKVAAIWGRDKFNLTPEDYNLRVQCYKRLTKLWDDEKIKQAHPAWKEGGKWDQTNTVLVDDSIEKGRSEPYNLVEIPEFFGDINEQDGILPQVHDYLNTLAMHSNVSSFLRAIPFRAQLGATKIGK